MGGWLLVSSGGWLFQAGVTVSMRGVGGGSVGFQGTFNAVYIRLMVLRTAILYRVPEVFPQESVWLHPPGPYQDP